MKIKFKKTTSPKVKSRLKVKARIRRKIDGTPERPRLSVYKSLTHVYAQIIDDQGNTTLASASSLKFTEKMSGVDKAKAVGKAVAEAAQAKNIKNVVFDRNGFIFHGKIKAVAEAAREAGLNF
ncbi:MAG: 50S ribosomal protein L18 [Bdellovibrionota bacterium]|nr:50S ribosomal protein L18 [Bdellovibrionota bacterium]